MANNKIKVGITHGDTNGIGYEVILKAMEDPRITELCTPVIYGSAKAAAYYRKGIDMQPVSLVQIADASQAREDQINIINVVGDVLVTAPINKDAIQSPTFHFPGHTEYLESSLGEGDDKSLMMLCTEGLRVALVTTHTPLSKVPEAVTKEAIAEKLTIFNNSLRQDFGIEAPKIAVLSLNPHAGENGLLGSEEQEVITPAINEASERGIWAFGPYASDGFFGTEAYKNFDGVLAMYHDQGLTPFKTLAMSSGVNFTAGLKYVRTSPDHGTGFDIAGQDKASPESMLHAIYMAIDVLRNRRIHASAYRNPLRRQYFDKSKDNVVLDLSKDDSAND